MSTEEGKALAKSFGCAFIEASARTGDHVAESFELAIAEIEKSLNPETAKPQESKCIVS